MRKALVVGVDYYSHISPLFGCVKDAYEVKNALDVHADGSVNFGINLVTATDARSAVTRSTLRDLVKDLFRDKNEIALFYFAGHGHIESTGGYLCASDCKSGDDGLALSDLLVFARESPASNKVIVLDSCFSGVAGDIPGHGAAELTEGMTILTASTKDQYASEKNGGGLFTTLFVDALNGAASNLVGDITPGSVYAHVDQSLGVWKQRPIFKTNVRTFVSLRKVTPPIALADLKRITEFFPAPGSQFQLDPSFEPELKGRPDDAPPPDPVNTEKFGVLQRQVRVNLVRPVGADHMWHAAMASKTCKLTALGEHYRRLVEDGLI